MPLAYVPHPLERRIHDGVMQLLGTALLKTDMCEQLESRGRTAEIPVALADLRSALEASIVELRSIVTDLRTPLEEGGSVKNRAA